jgi:RNA polymerase sigma-70 factor (ECF subfamily)
VSTEPTFDDLVREHGRMIARIAASHEARPHLAEELVQDIWFAVWRALPAFRGDGPLKGFVARIASNRAASHVARAVRLPGTEQVSENFHDGAVGPETAALEQDASAGLMAAVRQLPLVTRQVVTLTLEGFEPREIAAALGLTSNAVSIRLTRAKTQLRHYLGDDK